MNSEKKSVLVVDDDPIQIKLVETILSDEGYDVLSSMEADQGLQMAMTKNPDIIQCKIGKLLSILPGARDYQHKQN